MTDIKNLDDIKIFVDNFYAKVRKDSLLAPVFASRITGDWQPHLDTMYRFWNASLFQVRGYTGNPMAKHLPLPLTAEHFERWLQLFHETVDAHFAGPRAEEAKQRAGIMALSISERMRERRDALKKEDGGTS